MCINCAKIHKMRVLAIFLSLVSERLGIIYNGSHKRFSGFNYGHGSCIINWVCIMCIDITKKAKTEVFGHFHEFDPLVRLDMHILILPNVPKRSGCSLLTD